MCIVYIVKSQKWEETLPPPQKKKNLVDNVGPNSSIQNIIVCFYGSIPLTSETLFSISWNTGVEAIYVHNYMYIYVCIPASQGGYGGGASGCGSLSPCP